MSSKRADSGRVNFWEITVEGHPEQTRGLLAGLVIGSCTEGRLWFSQEVGVTRISMGEKLRELVGLQAAVSHIIVDSTVRSLVRKHAKKLGAFGGMRVAEEKRIRSASFDYEFHAYARKYAQEIQKLLKTRPRGVRAVNVEEEESVHEESRGLEAYSPAHHYEIEGSGTLVGRIDQLIELRPKLEAHPLIRVEPIELRLV